MDVYIFDLEHLARAQDFNLRPAAVNDYYDLSELNRLVFLDFARRSETS